MENGNPIEQVKGFAEKKLHALRENPDESGTRAYLAKMRKGVGKVPGADPELWGILFEDLPEELTGRGNNGSLLYFSTSASSTSIMISSFLS